MECCTVQYQPPPVGQPRPSSPPAGEAIRGAAGLLCSVREGGSPQRLRLLSCPACPEKGQDPFSEDSEVRSCPAPRVARIQLGSAVPSWFGGGGAVHPHQCPSISLRPGEKGAAGRRRASPAWPLGLGAGEDRSPSDHLDPRGFPPAAVPSFCESRQHCVPDGSYLPQTVQEEKGPFFQQQSVASRIVRGFFISETRNLIWTRCFHGPPYFEKEKKKKKNRVTL